MTNAHANSGAHPDATYAIHLHSPEAEPTLLISTANRTSALQRMLEIRTFRIFKRGEYVVLTATSDTGALLGAFGGSALLTITDGSRPSARY